LEVERPEFDVFAFLQRIELDFSGITIEDISVPGSFNLEALF
jgi:hypothetical protein